MVHAPDGDGCLRVPPLSPGVPSAPAGTGVGAGPHRRRARRHGGGTAARPTPRHRGALGPPGPRPWAGEPRRDRSRAARDPAARGGVGRAHAHHEPPAAPGGAESRDLGGAGGRRVRQAPLREDDLQVSLGESNFWPNRSKSIHPRLGHARRDLCWLPCGEFRDPQGHRRLSVAG